MLLSLFVWCIIELHAMDEKMLNEFFIRIWTWISHVIKACLIHDIYCVYVVEALVTLNWEVWYTYTSPFSRMPLVRTHFSFFLYKLLIHKGFNFPLCLFSKSIGIIYWVKLGFDRQWRCTNSLFSSRVRYVLFVFPPSPMPTLTTPNHNKAIKVQLYFTNDCHTCVKTTKN